MKYLRIAVAFSLSAVGVLLPWRLRCLFSESLGWLAQVLPPAMYQVENHGSEPEGI